MSGGEINARKTFRIILIGHSTAGKTTLCQRINHEDLVYRKTQTVQIFSDNMIDTPGEYLERPRMRGALMVTSVDADLVVFVQDATVGHTMLPPAYNSMFGKPAVGVVTKSDLATEEQIDRAKSFLDTAGAEPIFVTSSVSGEGIEEFLAYLKAYQDGAE